MNFRRGMWMGRALFVLVLMVIATRRVEAASISLVWDPNPETNIAGYAVYYGTTSGTYTSIVDVGNTTSYTLNGLIDGQRYYFAVDAYTTDGTRSPRSAEVSGVAGTAVAADITNPAPSSTLTGASVLFQWSAGAGVTSYRLSVGTSSGATNIFDLTLPGLSQTVTGLPTTGGTLYVRLWSLIGGMWRFNDYTYTAANVVCAFTLTPTSSSVGAAASTGTAAVTTTPASCAWTATSSASWISITGGSTGIGNGTVSYSVAANTTTSSRTGTFTAAGKTFTVTQAATASTRIIALTGPLAFSNTPVGTAATKTLTISNSGNAAMTVTSITYPAGFSGSWSGSIAAGGSQVVTVTFTPTAATSYSGTITVNANQTSGTATISASGTGNAPGTGVVIQDTFTGTTGSLLSAHAADLAPAGATWTLTGATPMPTLRSGQLGVNTGTGHLQVTLDSGVSNMTMTVDYVVGSGLGMGALAFRLTDANNHFLLTTYANELQLFRRQAGTYVLLDSQPLPALVPGTTHRLEVRAVGSAIEGWWDNVRVTQATDAFQQTATRHGLDWNSAYDASSQYDNLVVTAVAAPPPPALPTAPSTPAPAMGASSVSTAPTLTWSATGATSYDVRFGTANPPPSWTTGLTTASAAPTGLTGSTTYFWQVVARNSAGTTTGPVWSFTTASAPPPPPPGTGVVVQDTFTGTTGSLLSAHVADVAPAGSTWTLTGATPMPTLQSGRLGVNAGTGHLQVTLDSGVANMTMAVDYVVGSGLGMGALAFRLTDANNYFLLTTYANELQLFRRQAGTYVLLDSRPLPADLVPGTTHRLEVRALGSAIEGWWDNVRVAQATDAFQQTATRHGLDWNSAYDASSQYDNLVVTAAATPPPPALPTAPSTPAPATGASSVSTAPTLTWSATGATSYDVRFGTANPPPSWTTGLTTASAAPTGLTGSTTYFWQVVARNSAGTTTGPVWSFTTASAPPPPPPGTGVVVQDTFTGTTGSLLSAHVADLAPAGATWTLTGATPMPTLQSGKLGVNVGTGHLQVTLDSGVANMTMAVDYVVGSGPGMGALAFRLTDTNNHFLLTTYANELQLFRRQAGTYVLLDSRPLPADLVPGTTHRLEVRAVGSMLEGWWDNVRVAQATDAFQQTATRHGLDFNSSYDVSTKYDNLVVTAAAAPPPAGTTLVQDTFTGTTGSLLSAHAADLAPAGAVWALTGATPMPTLRSGRLGVNAGTGHVQVTLDSGAANVTVAVDYVAGSGAGMGAIAFRLTDTNNHLLLTTYANELQLYRRQAGVYVLLDARLLPAALVPGTTHRLEVRAVGNAIEGWWDNVRVLQATESFQQAATRHGVDFNSAFDASTQYDNFLVVNR